MGRELEEGLIRTHQPEKPQRKRKKKFLLQNFVHGQIALRVSSRFGEPKFETGAAICMGKR